MLNLKNKVVFKGDRTLWYVVIGLMLASLIVVYSSTGSLAFRVRGGNTSYYLIKQLFLMFGCMVVILTLQSFHYKYFLSFAKIVLGMSFIFLLWAKFAGTTLNDAGRWVTIPGIGFTFQPSEMAKLGIIMYCARAIAFEQTEECCSDNVLWRMTLVVPVLFLIFMENFSTSALLGGVCLVMLFVGRLYWKTYVKLIGVIVGLVILMLAVVFIVPEKHLKSAGRLLTVKSRIEHFVNPSETDSDDSYQSDQAKIAVAKGGLMGLGPGNSVQRNFLPHPYSDFIFAIIVEEYGLVGAGIVMLLYLIILYRVGVILFVVIAVSADLLVDLLRRFYFFEILRKAADQRKCTHTGFCFGRVLCVHFCFSVHLQRCDRVPYSDCATIKVNGVPFQSAYLATTQAVESGD